jgi:DNA-binding transcriptional LysR family regulator
MQPKATLPLENLRSLVAIVEAGSMTRAALARNVTQSALSLQMKKLVQIVGAPLFFRNQRGALLTAEGETLVAYARAMLELNDRALAAFDAGDKRIPVRIGIVQDLAAPLVSGVLSRFIESFPECNLRVRVGNTPVLHSEYKAGLLDIILGLGAGDDPHVVKTFKMQWFGDPLLAKMAEIPLAVMDSPCPFRDAAITALDGASLDYRIVMETAGISVLRAAVERGLALTLRTSNFFFPAVQKVELAGEPLGEIGLIMHHNATAPSPVLRLSNLILSSLGDVRDPGIYRW